MFELSIVIPARNEEFLPQTVEDLLKHTSDKTEIIVGLDGYDVELPAHPRLRVHKEPESIGQRAMQNRLVEMSTAKYVAKTDAHCAFDEDFDTKMLARMEDDITLVPVMRNLHIFDWVCDFCEWRGYQGPQPDTCPECQSDAGHIQKQIVWNPKTNPQSSAYRFNKNLQFKYFPELRAKLPREGLQESMSLQGSFFMCTREKYWSLKLCDESWGSWGNQGSEVAIKTWLSGGRVMCNFDTWYAHLFRTQSGFSFPYPMSGTSQEKARQISRDLFLTNSWEHQIRPLSWILDRFWFALVDVRDRENFWGNRALRDLKASEASIAFPRKQSVAGLTSPSSTARGASRKLMPTDTMSPSGLDSTIPVTPQNIDPVADESKVVGVDTPTVATDMVNDGDIGTKVFSERTDNPSVHNSVDSNLGAAETDSTVTEVVAVTSPLPATGNMVKTNLSEEPLNEPRVKIINGEPSLRHSPLIIPQRALIYYTAHQKPVRISRKVQDQLRRIAKDKNLEIVSASLKPMNFGTNIVLNLPPGKMTYFAQIISALRSTSAEVVYMCEDDVLYHPSHFDYKVADDRFHYNQAWWKIRPEDGFAASWDANQVSGLVARREPLLAWYIDKVNNILAKGFDRRYEPGGRNAKVQIAHMSAYPNIDIRTGGAMTANKWSLDDFRDKSTAVNFQTSSIDNIPGWEYDKLKKLIEN